jgi:nitrogen fixation protein NifU and related proteins
MTLFHFSVPFCALLFVAVVWFVLHYYANPVIDNPDGIAKITGNCGDAMEISLKFLEDKVQLANCWTNGCSFSKLCVETAAMLARDKTAGELQDINMATIMDVVGQLPDTHLHCAQLAEITLHRATQDYLSRRRNGVVESKIQIKE